jgi:hypothetical protein
MRKEVVFFQKRQGTYRNEWILPTRGQKATVFGHSILGKRTLLNLFDQ